MSTITIQKIGITQLATDAVVNAANSGLRHGTGVCGNIFHAAGVAQMTAACNKIGGCEVGAAVITPGFNLPAKYVIHAVGPIYSDGKHNEAKLLYSAYKQSLLLAKENGLHSIGFPLISAGIFGYPKEEAWQKALEACQDFLVANPDYEMDIVFAVLDDTIKAIGERLLADMGRKAEPARKKTGMKLYDISQEVFSCAVYPGDPSPEREVMLSIADGAVCNLTAFRMCAHNGTHVDAPFHFLNDGKKIDQVDLARFVGFAYVAEAEGEVTADVARRILKEARECDAEAAERILVKGKATVTLEAAKVFAEAGIKLYGNESQTVGPEDAPMQVHLTMLGAEIVLLEGIRLAGVPVGKYLLDTAPINLGGADGAPCRAILIALDD